MITATFWGPIEIHFLDLFSVESMEFEILSNIRIPRVIAGFFIGGALAIVGAVLQIIFSNPLADSGLIGISAGSMVAVVIGIVIAPVIPALDYLFTQLGVYTLPLLAFAGGLFLVSIVYKLSLHQGRVDVRTMLLAGIAMNSLAGAVTGLIIYMADDTEIRSITFWTMGSLAGVTWNGVIPILIIIIVGVFFLYHLREDIHCYMAGEKQAICLGVDVEKLKRRVLIISALISGASVALTGMIGFVGLVVPHIVRGLFGVKASVVMLLSFLMGGSFLVLADLFSKTIVLPAELPIGVTTSLIGAPYFIFLLQRIKRGSNA
ncbi:FecCD family ABC transporter permease [Halobacteriovorax marinus]|nr:iron ABC transporter permease [Halobacteriovorax marinus]